MCCSLLAPLCDRLPQQQGTGKGGKSPEKSNFEVVIMVAVVSPVLSSGTIFDFLSGVPENKCSYEEKYSKKCDNFTTI